MSYYADLKKILDNPNWDVSTKEKLLDAYVRRESLIRAMRMVDGYRAAEKNYSKFLERKNNSKRESEGTTVIDK